MIKKKKKGPRGLEMIKKKKKKLTLGVLGELQNNKGNYPQH